MNVAARLEQLAEPGGVLVSGTAYDHLQGKVDLPLEFMGEQRVKNIERPVRAYRVRPGRQHAGPAAAQHPPRWPLAVAGLAALARLGGRLVALAGAPADRRRSPRSRCCRSRT